MVTGTHMLFKSTLREIKLSFERFIAILAIVALGVGFFGGLKVTKPAMIKTLNSYLNDSNFYDYRLLSSIGFDEDAADRLLESEYLSPDDISSVEGAWYVDALCSTEDSAESAFRIHSITEEVNRLQLIDGRLPENASECVIDDYLADFAIGDTVTITDNNVDDTLDMLKEHELTIVGTVKSPLYINFERGSTTIGTGTLSGFIYVPSDEFDCDYITELYVVMNAAPDTASASDTASRYDIYSDEYNDYIDDHTDMMEDALEDITSQRTERIRSEAQDKIDDARTELNDKKADAEEQLADAKKQLEDGQKEIEDNEQTLEDAQREINFAWEDLKSNREALKAQRTQLEEQKAKLQSQKENLKQQAALMPGYSASAAAKKQMAEATAKLDAGIAQIDEGLAQIEAGLAQVEEARKTLNEKQAELDDGTAQLEEARADLEDGQKEYDDSVEEFNTEIADAEQKLADAQDELDDLGEADTYVLTRDSNVGYACYNSDTDIVASVANVFPIFFFAVAVLICMTTMNRMVDEQRVQIGILKALGYSSSAIMGKYMFYAGSAALIGSVGGYLLGSRFLPKAIWMGYNILYNMKGGIEYKSVTWVAVSSISAAMLAALGATYYSVIHELREVPANLIRPKAPAGGKRVFLEYIKPLWSHMKFLHKVSARNIIRYKKRFFMMVLGISGCTALVIAGLGIGDSITGIAELQFEHIQKYDISISFNDHLDDSGIDEIKSDDDVSDVVFMDLQSVDAVCNGKTKGITTVCPEDSEEIMKFLTLREGSDEASIDYPVNPDEGVITDSIAEYLGVSVGDTVTLRDSDMNEQTVKIVGITENHYSNFIYLSPKDEEDFNAAWINIKKAASEDGSSEESDESDAAIHAAAARFADRDDVLNVVAIIDTISRVNNMMSGMNFIVYIVIACAGALAFIVLYNLTNINITERIREIATIKVLGFYPMETAQYVFRENMILTAIGILVGLPLGKALHAFIMYSIKIDMVSFLTYVSNLSYLKAVIITFVFAMIVNFLMYFKLQKINMAESLKSIE